MTQEQIVKGIMWFVPVVFGAGGVYTTTQATIEHSKKVDVKVEAVRADLVLHEKKAFHVAGAVEVDNIKQNQALMMQRQARILESLGAICQATNARCR